MLCHVADKNSFLAYDRKHVIEDKWNLYGASMKPSTLKNAAIFKCTISLNDELGEGDSWVITPQGQVYKNSEINKWIDQDRDDNGNASDPITRAQDSLKFSSK